MATANVDIANSALVKLGAPLISSLSDLSKSAKILNNQFAITRKKLISLHPWNFSSFRVELAATVNTPEFEFTKEFTLPSDCLRVFDTDLPEGEPWKVEFNTDNNRVLVCNSTSVKILYGKDITDPTKFPPFFEETLAWMLASDACYALTQSNSFATTIYNGAQRELAVARSMDAQESGRDTFDANSWIDARY